MFFIKGAGFLGKVFGGDWRERGEIERRIKRGFDGFLAWGGKFNTIVFATLKDFNTIIYIGIMRGGNVDGKVEAHFVKTVIDCGGGKDADGGGFETGLSQGGGEVGEDFFGRFASIAAD